MMYQTPDMPVSFGTLRSLMNGTLEDKREVLCLALTKAYEPSEPCEVYLRAFIERLEIDDILLYLKDVTLTPKEVPPIMPLWGVIASKLYGLLILETIQNYEPTWQRGVVHEPSMVHLIEMRKQEAYRRLDRIILREGCWQPIYDVWHDFVIHCMKGCACKRPLYDDAKFTTLTYVATLEANYTLRDS